MQTPDANQMKGSSQVLSRDTRAGLRCRGHRNPPWPQLLGCQELRPLFLRTDRDRDGTIKREEFYRQSVEHFYVLDKDRKGYLLLEDITGLPPEDFKVANRRGDGKLTLDEFINAAAVRPGRQQRRRRADAPGVRVRDLREPHALKPGGGHERGHPSRCG